MNLSPAAIHLAACVHRDGAASSISARRTSAGYRGRCLGCGAASLARRCCFLASLRGSQTVQLSTAIFGTLALVALLFIAFLPGGAANLHQERAMSQIDAIGLAKPRPAPF
jgi:hypothetical protein